MIHTPLVSIITISYNSVEVTYEFLKSVQELTYPHLEVLLIDNGSSQKPPKEWSNEFNFLRIIYSDDNLGFAGGNNLGIDHSKGDFLFFLNNDVEVSGDLIEKLIYQFIKDSSVGALSPKIKYFHDPNIIQYAGYSPINKLTGRNYAIGSHLPDEEQYSKVSETAYCHGAAMMVKREVIESAGKMPEDFFLYYEELDWCERIKAAGYKILYAGDSFILHKESMSIGKLNPLKTYYLMRNRIIFMRKNFKLRNVLFFYIYLVLLAIPKNLSQNIQRRDWLSIRALLNGTIDAFRYRFTQ